MSYDFIPLSEEDLNRTELVEDGVYDFEVIKSTRKVSRGGNPMAELNLKVWGKDGKEYFMFDYLVFSSVNLNIRKVKHFCDAVGLQNEYKIGQLPEELIGFSGKAHIIFKEGDLIPEDKLKGKPVGSKYPDKNIVEDYIAHEIKPSTLQPIKENSIINDDIPF